MRLAVPQLQCCHTPQLHSTHSPECLTLLLSSCSVYVSHTVVGLVTCILPATYSAAQQSLPERAVGWRLTLYPSLSPLPVAETLVVLDLCNNSLNDDMARMLASGLADNISVTHLNLSHNSISGTDSRQQGI